MTTATSITVRVPLKIRRRPGRTTVVMPVRDGGDAAIQTRADPALVKALARAFRYQRLLDEGRYTSVSEMAVAERVDRGYLGSLLRLTLLAPEVVEAVLDGRVSGDLTLPRFLQPFPTPWPQQLAVFRTSERHLRGSRLASRLSGGSAQMGQRKI